MGTREVEAELERLKQKGECEFTSRQLAAALDLSTQSVTRSLSYMVEKGVLEKKPVYLGHHRGWRVTYRFRGEIDKKVGGIFERVDNFISRVLG